MAHHSILEPDPDRAKGRSPAANHLTEMPSRARAEGRNLEADLAELTAKFSSDAGGHLQAEVSVDLALEVVLNEIVEQACLVTGASSAAVILPREGEWVCRASKGASAPDLGGRLSSEPGLTAECIRTQEVQRCEDTEKDARAEVEGCRALGVRSVIVLPILQSGSLLGVFAVFSTRPSAFGEGDERTLKTLSGYVSSTLKRASELTFGGTNGKPAPDCTIGEMPKENHEPGDVAGRISGGVNVVDRAMKEDSDSDLSESDLKDRSALTEESREVDGRRRTTLLTVAMAVTVLAFAALLTTIATQRLTGKKQLSRTQPLRAAVGTVSAGKAPENGTTTETASAANDQSAANGALTADSTDSAEDDSAQAASGPADARAKDSSMQEGSLTVYENGRVVFHMPPTKEKVMAQAASTGGNHAETAMAPTVGGNRNYEVSTEVVKGSVIYRVEPDYPEAALQQRVEGQVVLYVRAGRDGTTEKIALISGPRPLGDAAIAAVKQWRFEPLVIEGHAVDLETEVVLNFKLAK